MRLHKKLVATAAATLLVLGAAACETDPEALEGFEDPGLEDGMDDDL